MFQDPETFSMSNLNPAPAQPSASVPEPSASQTPGLAPVPNPAVEPSSASQPPLEQGLLEIIKGTLLVVKKKLGLFLGVTILNFLIVIAIMVFAIPAIWAASSGGMATMFLMIVLIGLSLMLISYLFYGSMSNQAAAAIRGLPTRFGESVSSTFKNTGRIIYLLFKIFIYSRIWLMFVILILFALIGMFGALLGGPVLVMILSFILGLSAPVIIIYSMVRSLRACLAVPVLMADPELTAQESLEKSLELTDHKWWLVFSFLTVFGFLMTAFPTLLTFLGLLTKSTVIVGVANIITVIFGILSYAISLSFFQVLVDRLDDAGRIIKLHVGVLIGAIVVLLLPVIVGVAVPLLGLSTSESSLDSDLSNALLKNMISTSSNKDVEPVLGVGEGLQEPAKVLTEEEKAAAKIDDAARIDNLKKLEAAVEKYHGETGIYPDKNHCVTRLSVDDWNYLKGFETDDKVKNLQFSELVKFPSRVGFSCYSQLYQYLTGDNYAFFTPVDDPANGNIGTFFTSLEEAQNFQPADGGKYYALVHLAGSAQVLDPAPADSAPVKVPRVKRN